MIEQLLKSTVEELWITDLDEFEKLYKQAYSIEDIDCHKVKL
jgi:hypothetical protein